jgi:flavin-binding protein dodecin
MLEEGIMSETDRRRFLKTAGTVTATGVVSGLAASVSESANQETLITGISRNGSVQEALQAAIAQAEPPYPDALMNFEVKSIKGRLGGIAGLNEVTVTISARFSGY